MSVTIQGTTPRAASARSTERAENPEQECPYTCLVSTAASPVLLNGGTKAVAGGTQTGGVVETWEQYYYGELSFDATHIVAASFVVESPWGKGMRASRVL